MGAGFVLKLIRMARDEFHNQHPISSTSQSGFLPPFHKCTCEQIWENCDYLVEPVEGWAALQSSDHTIILGSQIRTGYCLDFPYEKCCPDAISDQLSTFPKPSTTVSMGRVFH
jgi:hypothetical protein